MCQWRISPNGSYHIQILMIGFVDDSNACVNDFYQPRPVTGNTLDGCPEPVTIQGLRTLMIGIWVLTKGRQSLRPIMILRVLEFCLDKASAVCSIIRTHISGRWLGKLRCCVPKELCCVGIQDEAAVVGFEPECRRKDAKTQLVRQT
jgi:hypothetical protein